MEATRIGERRMEVAMSDSRRPGCTIIRFCVLLIAVVCFCGVIGEGRELDGGALNDEFAYFTEIFEGSIMERCFPLKLDGSEWITDAAWWVSGRRQPSHQVSLFYFSIKMTFEGEYIARMAVIEQDYWKLIERALAEDRQSGGVSNECEIPAFRHQISSADNPAIEKMLCGLDGFQVNLIPSEGLSMDEPVYQLESGGWSGAVKLSLESPNLEVIDLFCSLRGLMLENLESKNNIDVDNWSCSESE